MGLETEKAETCVFMNEEVFHSTIEPILHKKKKKARAPLPNRDPRDINAHLKVSPSKSCRVALMKDLEVFVFISFFNPMSPVVYRESKETRIKASLAVVGVISGYLCD